MVGGPWLNACSMEKFIFLSGLRSGRDAREGQNAKITGKARSSLALPESATRSERFLKF